MQGRFPRKFLDDLPILPKLLLIPAIPFVSLMLFSMMTYLDVQNFIQGEERLTHLYLLQKTAAQYVRTIADLETAFLGYVISEDDRYRERFQEGRKSVMTMDQQLEIQLPAQHARFEDIRALVTKSYVEKEALLQTMQQGNRADAVRYVREGRSREVMREVRKWMEWFDQEQHDLQQQELSRLSYDRTWTRFLILGGGLVTLTLVILALALIAHSIATPLTALSKVVGSTASQTIPSIPVFDRKDEIGELTTVMKKMSLQIRKDLAEVQQSEATLKKLNVHLSASEAKYRGLVDHAPLGIFMTKGIRVTFSNRYNQQLAGLDPESAVDPEAFRQRMHPEDRDRVVTMFAEAVAAGRPCEIIFRLLQEDGSIRTVLSQRVPIMEFDSPDVVYVGFNIDITTLDNLQLQLRRAEKLATLGQVAAGIAHELRNPLVGIGSTAKVLLDDFESGDPKRNEIEVILSETRRLDRIVSQIVDYARPRRPAPTGIDLNRLADEVAKMLRLRLEEKHLTIKVTISPMISEFIADRDLLRQVLLNIVDNAIDATPKGGPPIEIIGHELFREERPGLVIQVKDAGVGIPPELLPSVFQPFVTSGKKHGTGLGLAICQNIIESHEGNIFVTSEVGKGTIVGIWLPLEQKTALERV
ncbi:MAG: PAS domain S-box protein [Nitrospira sp. LK70]|nr:PAS domain S-box protein [Nitrospira sp. LK70]